MRKTLLQISLLAGITVLSQYAFGQAFKINATGLSSDGSALSLPVGAPASEFTWYAFPDTGSSQVVLSPQPVDGAIESEWIDVQPNDSVYLVRFLLLPTASQPTVNLSSPANQKLSVSISSAEPFKLRLAIRKDFSIGYLNEKNPSLIIDHPGGGKKDFYIDFSGAVKTSPTQANNFIFTYAGSAPYTGTVLFDNLGVGSLAQAPTATTKAKTVSESSMYPNPSNGETVCNFTLRSSSTLKLIVKDIAGKNVEEIEGENLSATDHSLTFNVSNYPKGMYFVNYVINGAIDKVEKLVVK